ncbi:GTP-binding protein Rho1 [Ceratobasidium sp. 394]|nr:GTP-binding protein Rho1 [Ceratobasidium sp. 394]
MVVVIEVLTHRRFPPRIDDCIRTLAGKDRLWRLMEACWNHNNSLRPQAVQVEEQLALVPSDREIAIEDVQDHATRSRSDKVQDLANQVEETRGDSLQLIEPTSISSSGQGPVEKSTIHADKSSATWSLRRHAEIARKLVIAGDAACGKTSLFLVIAKNSFPTVYIPTIFENYLADIEVAGRRVELALWDTAGHKDYDRLRPLSYPDAHVALIAFAIDSPESLDNVEKQWFPEVKSFCKNCPIILVGCKKELRRDHERVEELGKVNQHPVTPEEGMQVAFKIGTRYLECSAKTGEGVREVFFYAAQAALLSGGSKKSSKDGKCIIV